MDESMSYATVNYLLHQAMDGNVPAIQELASRALRVEQAEARAEEAEAKIRELQNVWLLQHRYIQHNSIQK